MLVRIVLIVSTLLGVCSFIVCGVGDLWTIFLFDKGFLPGLVMALPIWLGPFFVLGLLMLAWHRLLSERTWQAILFGVCANYPLVWPGVMIWLPWLTKKLS